MREVAKGIGLGRGRGVVVNRGYFASKLMVLKVDVLYILGGIKSETKQK